MPKNSARELKCVNLRCSRRLERERRLQPKFSLQPRLLNLSNGKSDFSRALRFASQQDCASAIARDVQRSFRLPAALDLQLTSEGPQFLNRSLSQLVNTPRGTPAMPS